MVLIIHSHQALFFGSGSIWRINLWWNAEYAAWGSFCVCFESDWRSFTQLSTLFLMYCSLNDSVPITDPRRHSPWSVILIPSPSKIFCAACIRLLSFIRRIVFAGLGLYPKSGPLACKYSHHFLLLPVIRLQSYHLRTTPVSLHHLQFRFSMLVSVVVWIGHTKSNMFRPSSASHQVMRVRFNFSYIFTRDFSWKVQQLASEIVVAVSVKCCISKIAFSELSSLRCCFLRKKSYVDFE